MTRLFLSQRLTSDFWQGIHSYYLDIIISYYLTMTMNDLTLSYIMKNDRYVINLYFIYIYDIGDKAEIEERKVKQLFFCQIFKAIIATTKKIWDKTWFWIKINSYWLSHKVDWLLVPRVAKHCKLSGIGHIFLATHKSSGIWNGKCSFKSVGLFEERDENFLICSKLN